MSRPVVGVIGGGAWGVALAAAAARTGGLTLLFSRRIRSGNGLLPVGVEVAASDSDIVDRARLLVLAVPSAVARDVARSLGSYLDGRHFVVHGVRGLVPRPDEDGRADRVAELETVCDVVRDETPVRRVGALGGPALASDLLAGRPSVMVCGSRYPEVNRALRDAFSSPDATPPHHRRPARPRMGERLGRLPGDRRGYARGVGLGPGLLAAVITRAVEEAARLAAAAGGNERTLLGLAGYGDLLASIEQSDRPEVLVGEALAKGKTLKEALADARQRVEAVELTERVVAWAEVHGVRAPILGALAHGVLAGRASDELVHELMMTGPMSEQP